MAGSVCHCISEFAYKPLLESVEPAVCAPAYSGDINVLLVLNTGVKERVVSVRDPKLWPTGTWRSWIRVLASNIF